MALVALWTQGGARYEQIFSISFFFSLTWTSVLSMLSPEKFLIQNVQPSLLFLAPLFTRDTVSCAVLKLSSAVWLGAWPLSRLDETPLTRCFRPPTWGTSKHRYCWEFLLEDQLCPTGGKLTFKSDHLMASLFLSPSTYVEKSTNLQT